MDPSLLYLLWNPEHPQAVWTKLEEQFQWKTWANKLHLRRKLFSLKLKEGGSVSKHIKSITEVYEELAVIGEAVQEEDKVVQLLASLPGSYNVLVSALEAQSEIVPKWELVTERLLHEETKLQQKSSTKGESRAIVANGVKPVHSSYQVKCHFCHKLGHIKKIVVIPKMDFQKVKCDGCRCKTKLR